MSLKSHEEIKSLQDLLDTLEQGRIAYDLLHELFFGYANRGCVQEIDLETYRKLQNYFNINEDE